MSDLTERTRAVARALYDSSDSGNHDAIINAIAENVRVMPPPYFPWGGVYNSREEWVTQCVPALADMYDIGTMKVQKVIADGEDLAILIRVNLKDSEEQVEHLELIEVKDGKAVELRVFCFDPTPVHRRLATSQA